MLNVCCYVVGDSPGECITSTVTHLLEEWKGAESYFYQSVLQIMRQIITVGCRRAAGGETGEGQKACGMRRSLTFGGIVLNHKEDQYFCCSLWMPLWQ